MLLRHKIVLLSLLFISWLIITSVALFNFGNQYYGEFASDGNWQGSSTHTINLADLGISVQPGIQVVHVRQDNCICNDRANQHKAQFYQRYALSPEAQTERAPADIASAGLNLPATPAVLIFNQGTLLYAGPYATGPLCSVSDSLIAPILLQTVTLPGVWYNSEAKACRCVVNSTS